MRLAQGQPVLRVALDLGYGSHSAFTAMFRRVMGLTQRLLQERLTALKRLNRRACHVAVDAHAPAAGPIPEQAADIGHRAAVAAFA